MCCGGGSRQPQPTSTQVVSERTEFPEEIKPYITDILGKSQALFGKQSGEGYQVFPGGVQGRIAPLESEQLEALEAYKGLGREGLAGTSLSSARPYFESGLAALGGSMGAFGPEQAQQYMNPYQQAVVDIAKREAERSYIPVFQGIGDVFEKSGGFGGSRQAVREAEASRNLQQQLGDIQTRGMQQAFEQGRAAFEQQKAREFAGAGQLFAQGPQAFGQAAREISALEAAGKQERAEDQRTKNLLYEQFQQEQIYPTKTLQEYQSMVRGFPYQPSIYRTEQNLAPSPGIGQQLMGGLATAGSIYGGMGGFSPGGFGSFGQAGGPVGGLASLSNYVSGGQIQGGLSGIEAHQSNVAMPGSKSPQDILTQDSWTTRGIEEPTLEELEKKKITMGQFWTVADQELLDKKRAYMKKFQRGQVTDPMEELFNPNISKGGLSALDQRKKDQAAKRIDELEGPETGSFPPSRSIDPNEIDLSALYGEAARGLTSNLGKLQDPESVRLMDDRNKQINKWDEIYKFYSDPKKLVKERVGMLKGVYDPSIKELGDAKKRAKIFKDEQLKLAQEHMDKREIKVNDRATTKLAKLATRRKKDTRLGEEGAFQNLFLNMLLPMSIQAGQDPRGFMSGALKGASDNMDAFVERFSKLKDNFATGEEKRDREETDIEDKKINDVFELEDVFNNRRQSLTQEHFKLTEEYEKEKSNVGMSSRAAELKEKLKEIEYEKLGADAAGEALELKKASITDVHDMARENAATQLEVLKLDIFDPNTSEGLKNQKDFNNKIESIRKDVAGEMGYMIGEDGDVMIDKNTPLKGADRRKWTLKFEARKKALLLKLRKYGTTYPDQVKAMLEIMPVGVRLQYDAQGKLIT